MDKTVSAQAGDFALVRDVVDAIAGLLAPQAIYLYNQKLDCSGKVTSFKLCVVGDFRDKLKAERTLYWEVNSDLPFDVLLYTPEEWEALSANPTAFACRIKKTGTLVYG